MDDDQRHLVESLHLRFEPTGGSGTYTEVWLVMHRDQEIGHVYRAKPMNTGYLFQPTGDEWGWHSTVGREKWSGETRLAAVGAAIAAQDALTHSESTKAAHMGEQLRYATEADFLKANTLRDLGGPHITIAYARQADRERLLRDQQALAAHQEAQRLADSASAGLRDAVDAAVRHRLDDEVREFGERYPEHVKQNRAIPSVYAVKDFLEWMSIQGLTLARHDTDGVLVPDVTPRARLVNQWQGIDPVKLEEEQRRMSLEQTIDAPTNGG